jgi:hypothetical protein
MLGGYMREVVRPRLLILTAGFLSALLVCATAMPSAASAGGSKSAGNGYVSWKTAADVVRGLKAHGFTCKRDGSTPDATQGFDLNGKPTSAITLVECDGYTVVLLNDLKKAHAIEKGQCKLLTAKDWTRLASTKGLTGKNFDVVSRADGQSFPAHAQPADFQRAFGGIVETDARYLTRMYGCKRPAA